MSVIWTPGIQGLSSVPIPAGISWKIPAMVLWFRKSQSQDCGSLPHPLKIDSLVPMEKIFGKFQRPDLAAQRLCMATGNPDSIF